MRKIYGSSRIDSCPFCGQRAVTENDQGLPVCIKHKKSSLDLKCQCGSWLDVLKGKYGPYCRCINCGNVNFKRALEMNPPKKEEPKIEPEIKSNVKPEIKSKPKDYSDKIKKETIVTSDDIDLYYT